jgi:hypothetical protein
VLRAPLVCSTPKRPFELPIKDFSMSAPLLMNAELHGIARRAIANLRNQFGANQALTILDFILTEIANGGAPAPVRVSETRPLVGPWVAAEQKVTREVYLFDFVVDEDETIGSIWSIDVFSAAIDHLGFRKWSALPREKGLDFTGRNGADFRHPFWSSATEGQ